MIALVTGASRGIGRAICHGLADYGADIVINYRERLDLAQELVGSLQESRRQAIAIKADVSDHDQVESMVQQALDHFGHIDVLVNNAGINVRKSLLETSNEDWDTVFGVNSSGPFYCTRAVAQHMVSRGKGGRIINLSSILTRYGMVDRLAYSASKAALEGFSRCCAQELAPHNITVNVVAPGTTNTEINQEFLTPSVQKILEQRIAVGRIAEPHEIAAMVTYLASDQASYITGQIIRVDGGWSSCDPSTVQRDVK